MSPLIPRRGVFSAAAAGRGSSPCPVLGPVVGGYDILILIGPRIGHFKGTLADSGRDLLRHVSTL